MRPKGLTINKQAIVLLSKPAIVLLSVLLISLPLLLPRRAVAQRTPLPPELLLTKSQDPLIRESAAQVLGQRGDPNQVPALIKGMSKDRNIWVRARCAEALGLIGAPQAIPALRAVLAREKDQRVRRMISQALMRLGQSAGIDELTWQLKTGTNHTKAEVMEFLVSITGQPLGQKVDRWMRYLRSHGRAFLSQRPSGAPSLVELRGLPSGPDGTRQAPCLSSRRPQPTWQQTCATVINLAPRSTPVTRQRLQEYIKKHGPLADHCWILIRTGWRDTQIGNRATTLPPPLAPPRTPSRTTPSPAPTLRTGITVEGARFLLQTAPHLKGVGIDAPALDVVSEPSSARALLLNKGRMVAEGLDDLHHLHPLGTRLLMITQSSLAPHCNRQVSPKQYYYSLILFGILP